jgi:glucose/mannose-6-phosphate isomerase
MVAAAATLPAQIRDARAEAVGAVLPDIVPSGVAVLGMGGSGIAGDVLTALGDRLMVVPSVRVKGYELPAFVDGSWLVLAVSVSGETEEVITATQSALETGAAVIAITGGGTLEGMVAGAGGTVIGVAADVPVPRAAFGAVVCPSLVLADRLGLVPEEAFDFEAAANRAQVRSDECRPEVTTESNPAKHLAQALVERVPIFYGGGPVGAVAAYRAKCDINENVKAPSFAHVHPELCHNEVCAWGEATSGFALVNLRTGLEHPQVARRMEIVARSAEECGGLSIEVEAGGEGALARLIDLVTVTQWASIYLAFLRQVDPGPIEAISRLKEQLASSG